LTIDSDIILEVLFILQRIYPPSPFVL
jgi:hypothetical protein